MTQYIFLSVTNLSLNYILLANPTKTQLNILKCEIKVESNWTWYYLTTALISELWDENEIARITGVGLIKCKSFRVRVELFYHKIRVIFYNNKMLSIS